MKQLVLILCGLALSFPALALDDKAFAENTGIESEGSELFIPGVDLSPLQFEQLDSQIDVNDEFNRRERRHRRGRGQYYDWGRGRDGWGYCYQWTSHGQVLNGGRPVGNYLCESSNPSYFNWSRGRDGWGYCYQWTPYGHAMNQGRPVGNYSCERYNPSYFSWGRGRDGRTYCYQWTPQGYILNQGRPVPNYRCF